MTMNTVNEAGRSARVNFRQAKGLALGATALTGHPGGADNAADLIQSAWDAGVRYFDTAPMYGGGRSETLLGEAIRSLPRSEFTLSTKVGRLVRRGEPVLPRENELWRYDFSRSGIRRSVEESLERLGTDRVDIAYIHDPDDFMDQAAGDAYAELLTLRDEGIVGAIGVGMTRATGLAELMRRIDLDAALLAGRLSLVDGGAADEVLPLVAQNNVALVIASALHAGLVDGTNSGDFHYQPTPPDVVERVAAIARVAASHGVPVGAAALQFVLAIPEVAMVLTGAADRGQLEGNLAWASLDIPAQMWLDLDAQSLLPLPIPAALLA